MVIVFNSPPKKKTKERLPMSLKVFIIKLKINCQGWNSKKNVDIRSYV